jgi:Uma2 family endonuclease
MARALKIPDVWTEAEYLSEENVQFQRHEFVDGHVFAMAGASEGHAEIKLNLAVWLRARLPVGCRLFDGDMKLRLKTKSDTRFYYPDVFVSCGPRDRLQHFRDDATLVVEILSPTTERTDRGEKLDGYMCVPSLAEYILIDQRDPAIEVFRRRTGRTRETYGLSDVIALDSVGTELPASVVYDGLTE